MTSPIRPQFFCVRPNGDLIPLLAVDELPAYIRLRGISRSLAPNETQGMASVGSVASRGQYYIVDGVQPCQINGPVAGIDNQQGRDVDRQPAVARVATDEGLLLSSHRMALQTIPQHNIPQHWIAPGPRGLGNSWLGSNVASTQGGTRKANNRRENSSSRDAKKEYCSYWIRHGECDYQQQGCLFRHEMPSDPRVLDKLGLRDIPRWYREKHGVSSVLSQRANTLRSGMAQMALNQRHPAFSAVSKGIGYPNRPSTTAAASDMPSHQPSLALRERPQVNQVSQSGSGRQARETNDQSSLGQPDRSSRRVDLLSMDLLTEYSMTDPVASPGREEALTYKAMPKENELMQPQGLTIDMQSLMPDHGASRMGVYTPVRTAPTQARSRKPHKSRQLYRRVPAADHTTKNNSGTSPAVVTSSKGRRNHRSKGSRDPSIVSKSSAETISTRDGSLGPLPPVSRRASPRIESVDNELNETLTARPRSLSQSIHATAPLRAQLSNGLDRGPEPASSMVREEDKRSKGKGKGRKPEIDLFDLALGD